LQKSGSGKSKIEKRRVQHPLRMQLENEPLRGGYSEDAALREEAFQT
jgi:hypothetical protein